MSGGDVTLGQTMKYIEENTIFTLSYNKETIPLDKRIQFTQGETSLYNLLYNLAKYYGLAFHRISRQIVVRKADETEKYNVTDEENNTIEGKVSDAKTNEPLTFVSVYLSGTTIGTSSDKNGNYKIGNIPEGKYTIVVSKVGYKPLLNNLEIIRGVDIHRNYVLENIPIEMNPIIVADHSDEYDAYLKELSTLRQIFKKYFLGQTEFSNDCIIENIDEVLINKKNAPYYEATCARPIIIVNNALGYKIECVLIHFLCNDLIGDVSCEFYPKFTELNPKNNEQRNDWIENRKTTFKSSVRRFLLSQIKTKIPRSDYNFFPRSLQVMKSYKLVKGSEKVAQFDSASGLYYLKFRDFLSVYNQSTEEQSFISLRSGYSYLDPGGYPFDPMSIQVSGVFAKHGIANLLPLDISYLEWEEQKDE